MANEAFGFDEQSVRKLAAMYRKLERQVQEVLATRGERLGAHVGKMHVAVTEEEIPAMTIDGDVRTPGSGEALLWKFDKDQNLTETTFRRTIYNLGDTPIPEGAIGLVWQELLSGRFVTVPLNAVGFIEFTLLGGISASTAACTVDAWWGRDPGAETVAVYDHQNLFVAARTGAKGIATWDSTRERYVVIECQSKAGWIRGTLNAAFTAGASAAASVLDYGGSQQDVQDPGSTLTVYDAGGCWPRARSGAKFHAIYDAIEDKYVVVWCEQICITGKAELGVDMCATGSGTITNFTVTSPAPFNLAPTSLPTSVLNPYEHRGQATDVVWLAWDNSVSDWVIIDVEKHELTVLISLRLNGGYIEGLQQPIWGEFCTDETWVQLIGTTEC
jgi:hypothetical protein